jgi:predicted alpha/beta hydrolase
LLLLGHSVGGQVAGFAPNIRAISALVGVAAQRGYWRYWPGPRNYAVYLFFRVYVPLCLKLRGLLPLGMAGLEDLPRGVAQDWARWGLQHECQDAGGTLLRAHFRRFTAPVLAISFDDDRSLAPAKAVNVLFEEHYVAAPRTCWHIRPGDLGVARLGHSGFFDARACPERLWQSTAQWMRDASLTT